MATSPAEELRKKSVRTSPVLWILGAAFAAFLGTLGARALEDIAHIFREPRLEELREPRVQTLEGQRQAVWRAPDERAARIQQAQRDLDDLDRAVRTAESNYRTWLDARATLGGTAGEDQAVRERRDKLDSLRSDRDRAARQLQQLRDLPDPRQQQVKAIDEKIGAETAAAEQAWSSAHRVWSLKVLGARLLLVLPIWALAAWLWSRRQRTRYPTLVWGYFAFAVWMLVYGVGPFLPHYGGYIPLTIGAAAAVWGSISLVKLLNRRAPLRRRHIVDAAIARHRCPACEQDYLLGRETSLDLAPGRRGAIRHYDAASLRPRACPACGLTLWGPCPSCKAEQLLVQPSCSLCGARYEEPEAAPPAEARSPNQAPGPSLTSA